MEFFRRQGRVPFMLFIILVSLLIAKVVFPQYLRAVGSSLLAQATPSSAPASTTSSGSSGGVPVSACSTSSINVEEYMAPKCNGKCPEITSTSSVNGETFKIQNYVEWINGNTFKQNSQYGTGYVHFLYQVTDTINFLQDSVWSPPDFFCDGTKTKTFYRVYSGSNKNDISKWGGKVADKSMSCGQTVTSNQFIKAYPKNASIENNPLMDPGSACSVSGQSDIPVTNTKSLIFQGKAKCNGKDVEAVTFVNTAGAGVGEVYFYCKGFGLCAFYNPLDFTDSKNQPKNWNETTDICDLQSAPKSGANYFEYNIQRANTQSVLNNFYDEYSVSCLPKEEYKMVKVTHDNCESVGCGNWNVSGDLSVTATGKLFGLLRNEKKAESRIGTNQAPSRLESIEGYLGTKGIGKSSSDTSTAVKAPGVKDLNVLQSPLFKLTTQAQQCEFALNKLIAVKQLCENNRIEGDVEATKKKYPDSESTCALDTLIPGSHATHLQLLDEVLPSADPTEVKATCGKIVDVQPNDDQAEGRKERVLSVPLAMDLAYRPAFIVAVSKFDGTANQLKNNLSISSGTPVEGVEPVNTYFVVDYLEVKVPAFGSDFINPKSEHSNNTVDYAKRNAYQDPLRITADVLFTRDAQTEFQKTQDTERKKIRDEGSRLFGGTNNVNGPVIGQNGESIYCYKKGKLALCNPEKNSEYDSSTDAIPPALVSFINAATNTQNQGQKCDTKEEDFYTAENKKKVAEQVNQIGSLLDSKDVGKIEKKTELKIPFKLHLNDIRPNDDLTTETDLYFVSPHNYNLKYAQQAFLNFLTRDQQGTLSSLGVLVDNAADGGATKILDPEQFSPLLKTEINDKLTTKMDIRSTKIYTGTDPLKADTPTLGKAPALDERQINYSVDVVKLPNPDGSEAKHPLIWKVAGQVASLPTRLMALVTTPLNSKLNEYTRGCTGEFATEDWLLGKCKAPTTSPTPEPECKDELKGVTICKERNGACVSCANGDPACTQNAKPSGEGGTAQVSDGIVQLAQKVSSFTCTPPEVIIGILAKESGSETYERYPYTGTEADNNPGPADPLTGDPTQLSIDRGQQMQCKNMDPTDPDSSRYLYACGAFQFSQFGANEQVRRYGSEDSSVLACLRGIGITQMGTTNGVPVFDTRQIGASMCVGSAKIWRNGLGDNDCTGADRKSRSLSDFSEAKIRAGAKGFHGSQSDGADQNYWNFIQQYKSKVQGIKGDVGLCKAGATAK